MGDSCSILLAFVVLTLLVALIGHGIWLGLAAIYRAITGKSSIPKEQFFQPVINEDSVTAKKLQQLHHDGKIDLPTFQTVLRALNQQTPIAPPIIPLANRPTQPLAPPPIPPLDLLEEVPAGPAAPFPPHHQPRAAPHRHAPGPSELPRLLSRRRNIQCISTRSNRFCPFRRFRVDRRKNPRRPMDHSIGHRNSGTMHHPKPQRTRIGTGHSNSPPRAPRRYVLHLLQRLDRRPIPQD